MIGWINDLSYFHHLVSLSLSDNQLNQFPVSLCSVKTLQVWWDPKTASTFRPSSCSHDHLWETGEDLEIESMGME